VSAFKLHVLVLCYCAKTQCFHSSCGQLALIMPLIHFAFIGLCTVNCTTAVWCMHSGVPGQ